MRVRELKADTLPVRESVILNVQLKTNGRYEQKTEFVLQSSPWGDVMKTDCRIEESGSSAAIKMQSKSRMTATWAAGDGIDRFMSYHIRNSL